MSQGGILNVAGGGGGGSPIETITTNSGTATPFGNNINLYGVGGVSTSVTGVHLDTINIAITGTGFTWNTVTSISPINPVQLLVENGYICAGSSLVTFLLPLAPSVGDTFKIFSYTSRFQIIPNGSQQIVIGAVTGLAGSTGTATSNSPGDEITMTYMGGNVFQSEAPQGTITVVYA